MNLKESFRYQNFLERMMMNAESVVMDRGNALTITKTHNRHKANPDAEDITETVEVEGYIPNDTVIRFMEWLIEEREKLTSAIGKTKSDLRSETGLDIDAAVESNKFRQSANKAVKTMLSFTAKKRTERGQDYRFNAEGNQMPYFYEIEVAAAEAYDKDFAKSFVRSVITEADKYSEYIDKAMITSTVDYLPRFDVNETFDDIITNFITEE